MSTFANVGWASFLGFSLLTLPVCAGTFVYVSNAEDGDIGVYSMGQDGELQTGGRAPAAKLVMPMAVSPDRRFLYAAVVRAPIG